MRKVGLMKRAVEGYLKCLEVIRLEQLTKEEIESRISKQSTVKVITNIEEHINLLNSLNTAYSSELSKQNTIDFDDMITNANDAIINKIFTPTWQHILVDEFQDISSTRYKFLDCLIKNYEEQPSQKNKMERARKVKLTVVGDDWQSIYRFSGGNLELTTQFNQLVGSHTLSKLQKTFRYNNSIANVAGRFVMENIAQYKKRVTTHNTVNSPQVFLHDDLVNDNACAKLSTSVKATSVKVNSIEIKVQQLINLIIKNNPQQSIAVIARYQKQLNSIQNLLNKSADSLPKVKGDKEDLKPLINFWTYHGSKGLEADNTILIGFDDGAFGFPAVNKTHAIVDLLLPKLDPYPNTEERRLMYVGLTRAKNQTHLIANPNSYSVFIKELINNNYNINILSSQFTK
jgi:DNA helicase-4